MFKKEHVMLRDEPQTHRVMLPLDAVTLERMERLLKPILHEVYVQKG